ncbi:MAG: hypothetical protein A2051_12545 [Desulfovibrionales bacterium GWA2_65_9]|nr:MAG: hypothetical protein A2051_12545 [Desulfovibrionales bacterium GWA2_65_9]
MSRVDDILNRIDALEKELREELRTIEPRLRYTIQDRKVRFSAEVKKRHKLLVKRWFDYVYDSGFMIVLTIPLVWSALIPMLILDAAIGLYQLICFPVYGIPFVKRREYIVFDRHSLSYLNFIEKVNCTYCAYFNGVMGYVREVAARTEQYWCPIRHARPVKPTHSRYRQFFPYGDAEAYRSGLAEVRKRFEDLKPPEEDTGA